MNTNYDSKGDKIGKKQTNNCSEVTAMTVEKNQFITQTTSKNPESCFEMSVAEKSTIKPKGIQRFERFSVQQQHPAFPVPSGNRGHETLKTPKQTRQHRAADTNFVVPVLPDGSQRRQTGATRVVQGPVYQDHQLLETGFRVSSTGRAGGAP